MKYYKSSPSDLSVPVVGLGHIARLMVESLIFIGIAPSVIPLAEGGIRWKSGEISRDYQFTQRQDYCNWRTLECNRSEHPFEKSETKALVLESGDCGVSGSAELPEEYAGAVEYVFGGAGTLCAEHELNLTFKVSSAVYTNLTGPHFISQKANVKATGTWQFEVFDQPEHLQIRVFLIDMHGSSPSQARGSVTIDGIEGASFHSDQPNKLPKATGRWETQRIESIWENTKTVLQPGLYTIRATTECLVDAYYVSDLPDFPNVDLGGYRLKEHSLFSNLKLTITSLPEIVPKADLILNHIDHLDTITLKVAYDGLGDASSLDSKDLMIVSRSTPSLEYPVRYLGMVDGAVPVEALYEIPIRGFPAGEFDVKFRENEVKDPDNGFLRAQELGPILYCPKLLPRRSPPQLGELDSTLKAAVEDFRESVTAEPGSPTFRVTSGVRDNSYQGYLYQMRTAYLALALLPNVNAEFRFVDDKLNRVRPQLDYSGTPLCKSTIDELNTRILSHSIGVSGRGDGPGVNPPGLSNHLTGNAVDVAIGGNITPARITQIALGLDLPLCQPVPSEPHHFELCGSGSQGTALQINGNSPINILVTASDGRRIGHDPESGAATYEWPGAEYSGSNVEPQWIALPNEPLDTVGELSITGIGTGSGSYTISVAGYERFSDVGSEFALFEEVVGNGFASAGTMLPPISRNYSDAPPTALVVNRYGQEAIKVSFLGPLEESSDLVNWSPVDPHAPSPLFLNAKNSGKFWRLKSPR